MWSQRVLAQYVKTPSTTVTCYSGNDDGLRSRDFKQNLIHLASSFTTVLPFSVGVPDKRTTPVSPAQDTWEYNCANLGYSMCNFERNMKIVGDVCSPDVRDGC